MHDRLDDYRFQMGHDAGNLALRARSTHRRHHRDQPAPRLLPPRTGAAEDRRRRTSPRSCELLVDCEGAGAGIAVAIEGEGITPSARSLAVAAREETGEPRPQGASDSHHQPPLRGPGGVALGTDAADDQRAAVGAELMLAGHVPQDRVECFTLELDHRPALLADEVVVEGVAVVVVEDGSRAEFDPPQQARVHQFRQRAVNGRAADALARRLEFLDELIGVEVRVLGEDVVEQLALLLGEPLRLRTAGEIFAELALRASATPRPRAATREVLRNGANRAIIAKRRKPTRATGGLSSRDAIANHPPTTCARRASSAASHFSSVS